MKPIFKIGKNDYTAFLAEDGLAPVRNDLDADGSGRNLLDGLMYRTRIAQKDVGRYERYPSDEHLQHKRWRLGRMCYEKMAQRYCVQRLAYEMAVHDKSG